MISFDKKQIISFFYSFQDFENDLLSQASRIKDIRNIVRQEHNSSSQQELRSLVNQTSDHAQDLFTISKNYSDKYKKLIFPFNEIHFIFLL